MRMTVLNSEGTKERLTIKVSAEPKNLMDICIVSYAFPW